MSDDLELIHGVDARIPSRVEVCRERHGQVLFYFENGWGASVIRTNSSYGGHQGLFELAVLDSDGNIDNDNDVADGDVRGWLDTETLYDLLVRISEFPKQPLSVQALNDQAYREGRWLT